MNRILLLISLVILALCMLPGIAHGQFKVLYSFAGGAQDGFNPEPDLTVTGSTIYGATVVGGTSNLGTVYSLSTTGGPITLLHSFSTQGGNYPYVGPILSGSNLYGTTQNSGPGGGGIVYSMSTSGGPITLLHSFSLGTSDGRNPEAMLTLAGSTLYGTTAAGGTTGTTGNGTVYSLSASGGPMTLLHSFAGASDGANSRTPVTVSGSTLYGANYAGGPSNLGNVYSLSTSGGPVTLLHSFTGGAADGANPEGKLVLAGSTLYGTTVYGGATEHGTIYSLSTSGGSIRLLHSFVSGAADGYAPVNGLVLVGSTLYGVTDYGGTPSSVGVGTLFKINTDGSGFQVLHSFNGSDGENPQGLVYSDSMLYGETFGGGAFGGGTVFSFTVPQR